MNRFNAVSIVSVAYGFIDLVMNVESLLAEPRKWAMFLLGSSIIAAFAILFVKDLFNRKMQEKHSADTEMLNRTEVSVATGDEEIGE